MSLSRAFNTNRDKEPSLNLLLRRSVTSSTRNGGRSVKRAPISSPVALISTTNALSYDAPNLPGTKRIRNISGSSVAGKSITGSSVTGSSSDESEAPSLSFDGTDASSIDETLPTPELEPNHLSCYFKPAVDTKKPHRSPNSSAKSSFDAPSIPQRVPSHSKKAHEFVHRKRSVQRLMSPPASLVQRNSTDFFGGNWTTPVEAPKENPFSNELAQLDAVAEEMSHAVRDAEMDDDEHIMQAHDLALFGVDDYMSEIGGLVFDYLLDEPVWI